MDPFGELEKQQNMTENDEIRQKNARQLTNITKYIRKTLKESGINDRTLGYQIDLAASSILAFRKVRDEFFALESVIIEETSREGASRKKAHPLLFEFREQGKLVQDALDKLTMNIKSKKVKADVDAALGSAFLNMNPNDFKDD